MYRPQNQSKFCDSNYHEQIPFFRETITIIDECTKLMKDDRIYLRNKIKDYLKQLRENRLKLEDWENEQMQLLIQIFVEANKKKSLSKIQRGDKVMDWLQIKLRKFIDNNKKERHKKEVESFRKIKGLYPKKQAQSHVYYEKSLERSRQFSGSNGPRILDQINKLSFNLEAKKKTSLSKYSLGKSNEKSPAESRRKASQNTSYSLYKQFDYLRKASKSKDKQQSNNYTSSYAKSKYTLPESKTASSHLSKLNKSLDNNRNIQKTFQKKLDYNGFNQKKADEKSLKNRLLQQKPIEKELTKHEIDKLTSLFSHHLNAQEEKKSMPIAFKQNKFLYPEKIVKDLKQDSPSTNKAPVRQPIQSKETNSYNINSSYNNSNSSRYESNNNKIQEMFRNSQNILADYEQKDEFKSKYEPNQIIYPQLNLQTVSNDELFTPPDFLAECRKFLFSSNKKRQQQDFKDYPQSNERSYQYKQTTFSDLLNESKERSAEKGFRLNQLGINEVTSENVSANLSTNKPESEVHFRLKNVSINTVEQLLIELFKKSHKVVLDRYQLGQIMSKSNLETQKLFQKYCDVLNESNLSKQRLIFDFVATVKYFKTLGQVFRSHKEYFCFFICSILDIRKKEYVDEEDIQSFYESLESSELDPEVLKQIHDNLFKIYKKSCEVEGGNIMTHWSIYYLELLGNQELLSLKQHLNKFQFQFDQEQDS